MDSLLNEIVTVKLTCRSGVSGPEMQMPPPVPKEYNYVDAFKTLLVSSYSSFFASTHTAGIHRFVETTRNDELRKEAG